MLLPQVLLNNGAEVGVRDKESKTPYDLIGKNPDLGDGETELEPALVEWLAAPSSRAAVRTETLLLVKVMIN